MHRLKSSMRTFEILSKRLKFIVSLTKNTIYLYEILSYRYWTIDVNLRAIDSWQHFSDAIKCRVCTITHVGGTRRTMLKRCTSIIQTSRCAEETDREALRLIKAHEEQTNGRTMLLPVPALKSTTMSVESEDLTRSRDVGCAEIPRLQ